MKHIFMLVIASATVSLGVTAKDNLVEHHIAVSDKIIAAQRAELAENTHGKGFGPQSPRDINSLAGNNKIVFNQAPAYTQMNLCNIHFIKMLNILVENSLPMPVTVTVTVKVTHLVSNIQVA
jgi:hypothetical protein